MNQQEILSKLSQAVVDCNVEEVIHLVEVGLQSKLTSMEIVTQGLSAGMRKVGEHWNAMEIFLPEVMASVSAYYKGLTILRPLMEKDSRNDSATTVIIGSIYGDVHTVGKDVVIPVLQAENFNVIDLGIDVKTQAYIDAVKKYNAQVVGLGTYMSETFMHTRVIVKALEQEGLRDQLLVVCGGPAVDEEAAKKMGADGAFNDAWKAVAAIKEMVRDRFGK